MKKITKNILVPTYFSYSDALIQTYTLPYLKIISACLPKGSKIFLLTLDKSQPTADDSLKQWNIENISIQYYPFGVRGIWMLIKTFVKLFFFIKKNKIDTIHAWCTTGGSIGYLLSVFTGKELIVDSFEPHAEAMVENGEWKKNGVAYKLLFRLEKWQANRAKYLIATTEGMKQYSREK